MLNHTFSENGTDVSVDDSGLLGGERGVLCQVRVQEGGIGDGALLWTRLGATVDGTRVASTTLHGYGWKDVKAIIWLYGQ